MHNSALMTWFDIVALSAFFLAIGMVIAMRTIPELRSGRLVSRIPNWLMVIPMAILLLLLTWVLGRMFS